MFGLTFEKLAVVVILAAFLIGPQRLPVYAHRLGAFARGLRRMLEDAQNRIAEESGSAELRKALRTFDPAQYDPRRIVREAFEASSSASGEGSPGPAPAERVATAEPVVVVASGELRTPPERPPGHWAVTGTSAHPRRLWVTDPPLGGDEHAPSEEYRQDRSAAR